MQYVTAVFSYNMEDYKYWMIPYGDYDHDFADLYEHVSFKSYLDEYQFEYRNETCNVAVMEGGVQISVNDPMFKRIYPGDRDFSEYDYDESRLKSGERLATRIPKSISTTEVNVNEVYPTIEEFMDAHYSYLYDDVCGAYGYWINHKQTWESYKVGGRASDLLLVKDSVKGMKPSYVIAGRLDAPDGYKWVDSAKIMDIEWEKMQEITRQKAMEYWDKASGVRASGKDSSNYRFEIRAGETKEEFLEREVVPFKFEAMINPKRKWMQVPLREFYDEVLPTMYKELYVTVLDCLF